jgi:hypothetical protein
MSSVLVGAFLIVQRQAGTGKTWHLAKPARVRYAEGLESFRDAAGGIEVIP